MSKIPRCPYWCKYWTSCLQVEIVRGKIPPRGPSRRDGGHRDANMNLKQYLEHQQTVYDAFAKSIKQVVEVILQADASIVRPQQIQTRAKSKTSLTRKLKDNNLLQSRSIEKHMKDLAGVRLIFYTNRDIDRFLNSGLLRDNFDIDYDASKIHEPSKVVSDANEQYRGIHYVVSFKADRLALPEYAAYKGLRCEIQI